MASGSRRGRGTGLQEPLRGKRRRGFMRQFVDGNGKCRLLPFPEHELAQLAEGLRPVRAARFPEGMPSFCSMAAASCTRPRLSRWRSSARRRLRHRAGRSFAGDLRDEREQPVGARRPGGRSATPLRAALCSGQPDGDGLAAHLAGGRARKIGLGPEHPAAHALELSELGVGVLQWPSAACSAGPRMARTAQGSGPAGVSMATTAQAATPGWSSMAASRSSGWILTPVPVTMTSLLRPRKRSSPVARASARSPVESHSSVALPQCAARPGGGGNHGPAHQHFAIGADLDFAPGERLADGALGDMKRVVERDQGGGFGHAVALHDHKAKRVPELFHGGGRAPPPEMSAQNLNPNARWTPRKRHHRFHARMPLEAAILSASAGCVGFEMGFRAGRRRGGRRPERRCARGESSRSGAGRQGGFRSAPRRGRWAESRGPWSARRRGSAAACEESAADARTSRSAYIAARACSMGSTLASTLPWVWTMPLGSPVVPEVKRICSGVSRPRPATAPASFVGQADAAILRTRCGGNLNRRSEELADELEIADGEFGFDVGGDADGEIGAAIGVEGNNEHAAEDAAVKGGDPFGAVLCPEERRDRRGQCCVLARSAAKRPARRAMSP